MNWSDNVKGEGERERCVTG